MINLLAMISQRRRESVRLTPSTSGAELGCSHPKSCSRYCRISRKDSSDGSWQDIYCRNRGGRNHSNGISCVCHYIGNCYNNAKNLLSIMFSPSNLANECKNGFPAVMRCDDAYCYISEEKGSFAMRRICSRGLEYI